MIRGRMFHLTPFVGVTIVNDLACFFSDLFLCIYIHINKTELPNEWMKYIFKAPANHDQKKFFVKNLMFS